MIVRDDGDDVESSSILHSAPTRQRPSLTLPLRSVFFLNGVILTLPTTALLYMVNVHVQLPVSWIPSYISLSFLPYSLKPLYAYMSTVLTIQRDAQITILLICSGIFYILTACIPSHAIILFFMLGFMRSLTTAWPDLLFDLVLIDEASFVASHPPSTDAEEDRSSYAVTAAMFQSQAATDRSLGCIVAHVVALLLLLLWPTHNGNPMNAQTFQGLFILAGVCNFVSALVAWRYFIGRDVSSTPGSVGTNVTTLNAGTAFSPEDTERNDRLLSPVRTPSYDSVESSPLLAPNGAALEIDSAKEPLLPQAEPTSERHLDHTLTTRDQANRSSSKVWLVVLLQMWIVMLTLRQPMVQATKSMWVWTGIAVLSLVAVLVVATPSLRQTTETSSTQLRVGVFLILRYAVPSISYLMSSYVYTVFQESPFLLQWLSLLDMGITTVACWTYRQSLSRYSSGHLLWWLIGITTALAGVASFGNVFLIRLLDPENEVPYSLATKVLCTMGINAVTGFFNQWKFLPDVVLATVSIDTPQSSSVSEQYAAAGDPNDVPSHTTGPELPETNFTSRKKSSIGMQYGTLMSCIDFGGQMGALVAGPLVAWLGTTRENHWQHLELLQELNSTLILGSIALLCLVAR